MISTTTEERIKEVTIITFAQDYKELLEKNVLEGLDFILDHFEEPIWPRTISTKTTQGRQIPVYNKQEAIARYKAANFLDCRINAYHYDSTINKNNDRQKISLIMIDIDKSRFKSKLSFERTTNKTLRKIRAAFGIEFGRQCYTRIWSGNGYHIYVPIESRYILEERPEFTRLHKEPSKQFLRFAEWYLSDGKADSSHYNTVSFGNCMLRIPGSHNSKCVARNNNTADSSTQVKILDKWNNDKKRVPIYLLIGNFCAYLADRKHEEEFKLHKNHSWKNSHYNNINNPTSIPWVERLIQTPIGDYRKNAIGLILAPYLINIRKLSYEEAFSIIMKWLENKCDRVRRLDSNFKHRVKYDLDNATKNGRKPIKLETLKKKDKSLYDILTK